MKKVFLLASMVMVITVSAQQRAQNQKSDERKEQRQRPSVDDQLKKFDAYQLTSEQKKNLKSLIESRDAEIKKSFERGERPKRNMNDFDAKLEKILDKDQYKQYQQNREERMKSKNFSMRKKGGFKNGKQSKKTGINQS
ncbi:hypothetical protein ACNFNZ_16160 [Empedobacter brevis]|uniref:hypothetical protein n=1 Tax=Empedobacter brevis TaxID=247 RepID=UPI0023F3F4FC|nr:hypothetical protein [Empedobacter brevis]